MEAMRIALRILMTIAALIGLALIAYALLEWRSMFTDEQGISAIGTAINVGMHLGGGAAALAFGTLLGVVSVMGERMEV